MIDFLEGLRYFPHIGEGVCWICGTLDDGPCILVGIDGTQEDRIEQAEPVHLKCLLGTKWRIEKKNDVIYSFRPER